MVQFQVASAGPGQWPEPSLIAILQGAHMGRIGLPELLIVLAIVVLIFGANRLPELGRGIGKGIRNFRDATKEGSDKT